MFWEKGIEGRGRLRETKTIFNLKYFLPLLQPLLLIKTRVSVKRGIRIGGDLNAGGKQLFDLIYHFHLN
ncbi:hypothetical protein Cabys_2888 [Caldithrix abyssi DSM 13497]|uniref:Uncharacterized protein n=1 Tax=Caldithrix abyssi DSM 13497 TaxID=880073 RepID=A0A1J1CB59_CALAY|nr:hypothetical protein Cabys_2888 [Caldithrix abyssi DSM 13497]